MPCWRTAPAPRVRLGAAPDALLGLTQVHGADGRDRRPSPGSPAQGPRADALVTDRPGIALGIVTADCAPVLFADPEAGVIGAAHAGWRGAVAGVLEATVAAMQRSAPASRRDPRRDRPLHRRRAPTRSAPICATPCSPATPADAGFFADGAAPDRWQFDLPAIARARLAAAGVGGRPRSRRTRMADEDRFFSHRRRTLAGGGPIGHQISDHRALLMPYLVFFVLLLLLTALVSCVA